MATAVEHTTARPLRQGRREILAGLGLDEAELLRRAGQGKLAGDEWPARGMITELDHLLGA